MTESAGSLQEVAQRAAQHVDAMRQEIGKALVGQEAVIEEVLIALLAGGHVLIEGVPGLGKTLLVQALAKTFAGILCTLPSALETCPNASCNK